MRALALIMLLSAAQVHAKTLVLSDDTTIVLRLPVTDESAGKVQLELMEKAKAGKPLYLVLNSPGGSVVAGKAIIETAKGLGVPVHTISLFSASMSFIISQYLDKRYVLDSSMLMTHRAAVEGMAGQIPGSLMSRVMGLYLETIEVDRHIAERSGMPLEIYGMHTANELWMTGKAALDLKFADEMVNVRCGKSLEGSSPKQVVELGFVSLDVVFSKCPLVAAPTSVKVSGTERNGLEQYQDFLKGHFTHYYTYTQRKGYAR